MYRSRLGPAVRGSALVAALMVGVTTVGETGHAAESHIQPLPGRHGYEQVQALVEAAVALIREQGPAQAFAAFNDPKGKWVKGDLYLFAFDGKGVYQASGFRPELTGTNAWESTDAAGLKVVQEIIKKAKRNGSGLVDYLWKNPASGKLENKTSYVVQIGPYVIGAGFYYP